MEKKEEKKGFLMYIDYEEHFKLLSDEQLGKLLRIIYEYERTGISPEIEDGMIRIAFSFIKAQLDRDKLKYEKEIVKRKVAGKKGSDVRWNNNDIKFLPCSEETKNIAENSNAINEMTKDSIAIKSIAKNGKRKNEMAKIADKENVKDKDTDNDKDNVVGVGDSKKILNYYKQQTKENPPATAISSLLVFSFSEDIIKKAIDIGVLRKKTNLDYISGILKSWSSKGFKTLDEILTETKVSSREYDGLYEN